MVPFPLGILHERDETLPFLGGVRGQAGQLEQSGKEVEELGGAVASLVLLESRGRYDDGHPGAVLPKGSFGPSLLFPEVESVIGEKGDDRIVRIVA